MPSFRISSTIRVFLATVRSAAVLMGKQAHLARIRDVSLPSIYGLIGRHVMSLQALPQDLCEARDAVRGIEERLSFSAQAGDEAGQEGKSSSAINWIRRVFQRLTKAIGDAPASVELQRAYETLGQKAAERHGTEAVPEPAASQLATALSREAALKESVVGMHNAGITAVTQAACLGVLLFLMAWVFPVFAAPPGLMFMVSVIRESLAFSPLAAALVLGMNCLLVSVMFVACSPRSLPTTMSRSLICLLAACTALTLWWMFSARREVTFFVGFYAWLACFVLFASVLWLRNRTTTSTDSSWNPLESFFGVPGLVAAALACFVLGWVLPVEGFGRVHGWGEFRSFVSGGGYWMTLASKATSLVAIAALVTLLTHQRLSTFIVGLLFTGCTIGMLVNLPYVLFEPHLRMGFYLWFASFCLLAVHTGRELLRRRAAAVGSCLIEERMPRFAIAGVVVGLLLGLPMISGVSQAMIGSSAPSSSVAHTARPGLRKPAIQEPFDWGAEVNNRSATRGPAQGKHVRSEEEATDSDVLNERNLEGIATGRIPADEATRRRAIALIRERGTDALNSLMDRVSNESNPESERSSDEHSPNRRVFSDEEWEAITASLVREGRVRRTRPQDAVKFFGVYAVIKKVFVDSGIESPSIRMLNGFKGQVCEATISARGPEAAAKQLTELVLAANQSGVPLVTAESAAQFEAGVAPAAVVRTDGVVPSRQAGGFTPNGMQQFEGACTKCGYRTGRQVNQSQRTCSQLGVGVDGTRPCGGVIVWGPAGGMPGAGGMVPQPQAGVSVPNGMQQFEGTCTKCGFRTGRQVNQTHRTCSQLGGGVDGTRPCGGVIAWAPAGAMPGAVPGLNGSAAQRQGSGYTPQRMQQFEGTCSKCGFRTGRQVNQSYRTCSQLGVGVDGTRPCGGVIIWAPAQGF